MTKEEFRNWRELCGLSQSDVAARFNLSRNTIQNWESGASPLPQHSKEPAPCGKTD